MHQDQAEYDKAEGLVLILPQSVWRSARCVETSFDRQPVTDSSLA